MIPLFRIYARLLSQFSAAYVNEGAGIKMTQLFVIFVLHSSSAKTKKMHNFCSMTNMDCLWTRSITTTVSRIVQIKNLSLVYMEISWHPDQSNENYYI